MADLDRIGDNLTTIRSAESNLRTLLNRWGSGKVEAGVDLTATQKTAIFAAAKAEFQRLVDAIQAIRGEFA